MLEHVRSVTDIIRGFDERIDRERGKAYWVVGLSRRERPRSHSAPYIAAPNYAAKSFSGRNGYMTIRMSRIGNYTDSQKISKDVWKHRDVHQLMLVRLSRGNSEKDTVTTYARAVIT